MNTNTSFQSIMTTISKRLSEKQKESIWIRKARELHNIRCKLNELLRIEKILSRDLQQLSQSQAARYGSFSFTPIVRKGSVDYSAIPELREVNLEQYRKPPVTSWKLSVVELE